MASAQWKNFQPPNQDGASYQRTSSFSEPNSNSSSSNSSGPLRETGIIEKLLHSYGFIQCCEKQVRLFFHYSQFCGNIEHLKIGDAVEFETTYDRKTGKPIAKEVFKIASESLPDSAFSEERVSGFVTIDINNGNEGRIAYENRGECFFLPYSAIDVDSDSPMTNLQSGDKVSFLILQDKQTGNPRARNVRLEQGQPENYQGVVCSMKESFGFIERSDVVKKIFFHSSECKDFKFLTAGEDVSFNIQERNGKEVATNVTCLPAGSVVFEDFSTETIKGQVIKVTERFQRGQNTDPLSGRIRYRRENKQNEIQFGENDTKGDFTLQIGDWVQFNIAVDRRDKLQRASNIEVLDESFIVSGEKREQGFVATVKDSFGFIQKGKPPGLGKTRSDSNRIFFRLHELLDPDNLIRPGEEVEFTVIQDSGSPNRYQAVRVRILAPGTVSMTENSYGNGPFSQDERGLKKTVGKVEKEAFWKKTGEEESDGETGERKGTISYQLNGETKTVSYKIKDCEKKTRIKAGDKVEFLVETLGNVDRAREVQLIQQGPRNGLRYTHKGFIAALKDSFGFIETEEHDKEIFFHFNVYDGNSNGLSLGQEVQYGVCTKGSKISADGVAKLPTGTIQPEEIRLDHYNGRVVRPVRCFNPDQDHYSGLIKVVPEAKDIERILEEEEEEEEVEEEEEEEQEEKIYPFGITSLEDKHDFLQKGDAVQFQVGVSPLTGEERAVLVKAVRVKLQANVEAINGSYGFLSHEVEEGKKLFFHMSEVKNNESIQRGDRVEFILMHNQRTGKHSACSLLKIGTGPPTQRPERLLNRLRTTSIDEGGPKVIVIRQPKGPEGSGFKKTTKNGSSPVQNYRKAPLGIISSGEGDLAAQEGLNNLSVMNGIQVFVN